LGFTNVDELPVTLAENMIQEANKLYGNNIKFLNTNAENILVEDNTQDIVTICCTFHHISNPQKALLEINRVLHNNGYFAFSSILNGLCNIIYPILSSGDVRAYNKRDLEILSANTGFSIENYDKVDKVSYIVKLRKGM